MANKFSTILGKVLKSEADDAARVMSREEAEIASDLLKQPGMSKAYDDIQRQANIDDARAAFTENTPAADAFRTFDDAGLIQTPGTVAGDVTLQSSRPNFNLQGKPYGQNFPVVRAEKGLVTQPQMGEIGETTFQSSRPNFDLQGSSYGKNFPQAEPKITGLPVAIDMNAKGLPVVGGQMDDVIEVTGRNLDAIPAKDKMSFLQKYGKKGAIGAGLAGAGLLGISALQDDQALQQAPVPTEKPITPVEQPASPQNVATTMPSKTNAVKAANITPNTQSGLPGQQEDTMRILDFGTGYKDTAANLEEQQNLRNLEFRDNQLAKAGAQLGAAIAGVNTPDLSLFDQNIKQADTVLSQYKERMEKEKVDPNSPLSKGMKQFMKSFGFEVKGDASAEELMKLSPIAERYYQSIENRELRKEQAAQRSEDNRFRWAQLAAQKDIAKQNKEAEIERKRGEKLEGYTMQMRKDLTSGPLAKQYTSVVNSKTALSDLTSFMENPTGYTDYGTLMRSLKVLQGDDSVVREAEMRLGQNAGSLSQKLQNYADQIATGRSLRPEQRQDIVNTLKVMDASATNQYKQAAQPYLEQARELGLNEDFILPGILRETPTNKTSTQNSSPQQKTIVKKQYSPSRNQTRVLYSDGSQEVLDGQQ